MIAEDIRTHALWPTMPGKLLCERCGREFKNNRDLVIDYGECDADDSVQIIHIPMRNLPAVEAKLAKLNKRAAKNAIPPVEHTVSEPMAKEEPRLRSDHPFYSFKDKVTRHYVNVRFTTEPVRLGGYEPVATYTFDHDKPTVFTWPDKDVPAELLNVDTKCEHCNSRRRRARVFLLLNVETGEHKRVGSSCVRDFIGYTPANMLAQYRWLSELSALGDPDAEDERRERGYRAEDRLDLDEILIFACAVVREFGYTTRAAASQRDTQSTGDRVKGWIQDMADPKRWGDPDVRKLYPVVQDADRDEAKKVLAEVDQIDGAANSYLQNLENIAKDRFATWREVGIAASMVVYAHKEWGRAREKSEREKEHERQQTLPNEWVGAEGDMLNLQGVRLTQSRVMDSGRFGPTTLLKFETPEGYTVTWFASNGADIDEGDTCTLRGRVKRLSEYKGRKETLLSRCRIKDRKKGES